MKEIIQKMRQQAHEIAVERRNKWWDALTPEQQKKEKRAIVEAEMGDTEHLNEFKPGVIELDPAHPPTPYAVQMQLLLLGVYVSLDDLAIQTREDLEIVALWAATAMLSASDNDVVISPRPEWLPGRDSANCLELVQADIEKHGGEAEVSRIYGDDWYNTDDLAPDVAPILDLSHEPEWATRLRNIAAILMDICPEEVFEEGVWILEWLNAGAPMFQPAKVIAEHDSPDTSVGENISTESPDGNDNSTAELGFREPEPTTD